MTSGTSPQRSRKAALFGAGGGCRAQWDPLFAVSVALCSAVLLVAVNGQPAGRPDTQYATVGASTGPASPSNKTVMVWLSDGMGTVDSNGYAAVVDFVTRHRNAINAVSVEGLYRWEANGTISKNDTAIQLHDAWGLAGFATFPIIGLSSIDTLRLTMADPQPFIDFFIGECLANNYGGINVDVEPTTNVDDPNAPPTFDDAAQYAEFLDRFAVGMHAAGKTVTVDTMSVVGACRSAYHYPRNLKPCPWIRRFWDFQRLSTGQVDKAISMSSYTQNDTEFPLDLLYSQWFFTPERLGVGLCPWCWVNGGETKAPPTREELAMRFELIRLYGIQELDLWELGANATLQEAWEPWWPFLEEFMAQ